MDVDTRDMCRELRETRCQKTASRTNLQDSFIPCELQGLQYAPLNGRRHHLLAMPNGNFGIGECQSLKTIRHEPLARNLTEYCKDVSIQYRPGSSLLLDHLLAREIYIHTGIACKSLIRLILALYQALWSEFSLPVAGQLFLNYGESPQRAHVAGICLQFLGLCKLLKHRISALGDTC